MVLLGFSYGGFVVTGALEHIAERIQHLVCLDAFVPGDGDTVDGSSGLGAGRHVIELGQQPAHQTRPAAARTDMSSGCSSRCPAARPP